MSKKKSSRAVKASQQNIDVSSATFVSSLDLRSGRWDQGLLNLALAIHEKVQRVDHLMGILELEHESLPIGDQRVLDFIHESLRFQIPYAQLSADALKKIVTQAENRYLASCASSKALPRAFPQLDPTAIYTGADLDESMPAEPDIRRVMELLGMMRAGQLTRRGIGFLISGDAGFESAILFCQSMNVSFLGGLRADPEVLPILINLYCITARFLVEEEPDYDDDSSLSA